MDAVIKWIGGKNLFTDKLISIMPEHRCYVEIFFGGGSLFFRKPVSKVEVVNDLNSELINLYRVLKNDIKQFIERERYELYSREFYYEYLSDFKTGKHFVLSDVERAFRFFYLINSSYNGEFGVGWSYGIEKSKATEFFNRFKEIDKATARLKDTYIENNDFQKCIESWDSEDTLHYCCLPGTKIRMKDERLVNIEDVKVGDEVFCGGKVLNGLKREYEGDIYNIEIFGLKDPLCVTSEHPIMVYNGLGVIEPDISDMSYSEYLITEILESLSTMEVGKNYSVNIGELSKRYKLPKSTTNVSREVNKIFSSLKIPYIANSYTGNIRISKYGGSWDEKKYSKFCRNLPLSVRIRTLKVVKTFSDNLYCDRKILNKIGIFPDELQKEYENKSSSTNFVEAKNLKIGNDVLIPLGIENVSGVKYIEEKITYYYYFEKRNLDLKIPCNYDTGWMFGLWLADGSITTNAGEIYGISYSLGKTKVLKRLYHKKLYQWFLGNIGIKLNITRNRRLSDETREDSWTVWSLKNGLVDWFYKLFGDDKIVNQDFMNYNVDFQRGLLRGWLDGDGNIGNPDGKRGNVQIEGSSRRLDLIEKMFLISLRLGLRPSLREKPCKSDGGIDYLITFSNPEDAFFLYPELFKSKKEGATVRKKICVINGKKYMSVPVTNIVVKHYKGNVHNLTTENNTYISNYVITHNCDPPYKLAPIDDYYFKSYASKATFSDYDHQRLYLSLKSIKGKFILSYDDCSWVRERYEEFNIIDYKVHYSSATKKGKVGKFVNELIITNYNVNEVKKHCDNKQAKLTF